MYQSTDGFTLVELLSALGIVILLAAVALPSAQHYKVDQQLADTSNILAATHIYARSESIKRRHPVLISNASGDWSRGWQVFVDVNDSGQLDPDEPVLRNEPPLPEGIIAKGSTPISHYIRYTPTGTTKLIGGAFQAGTLTLCHVSGELAIRRLVLSASGRLRRERSEPKAC